MMTLSLWVDQLPYSNSIKKNWLQVGRIERNGKKESAYLKLRRTLSLEHMVYAVEYSIIVLFSFFELSSASADFVKPAFCSVNYSKWQLPFTAGSVPRGLSSMQVGWIYRHKCLKIQSFIFLSIPSLAKITHMTAPQRYLLLLLILLILNIKIKYEILIF